MASDEASDFVWSDETTKIRDVVYSSLPAIVRVAEGYMGNTEAESFSIGDLLKLDFVKSVQKVYATVISSWREHQAIIEDKSGYMQPDHEIIIPLGYKGKVTVTRPPYEFKVYYTASELMRDFPRYVRVDKEFTAQSNENKVIRVKVGKRLELDRYLPTKGLIAKCDDDTIVIGNEIKGRFVPLPDETHYTLLEVIDRLPLPQYVRFVDDEFEKVLTTDLDSALDNFQSFTGCVKLTRVYREEIVVGHHKPQIPKYLRKENEKFVNRSVVILPLGRDAVHEIEVNVPIYSEPDEYEFLAARNFSHASPNMDAIEGNLYLEFTKSPKSFYMFDDVADTEPEASSEAGPPPPIPPRPKPKEFVKETQPQIQVPPKLPPRPPKGSVDDTEEYELITEKKAPTSKERNPPPSTPERHRKPKGLHLPSNKQSYVHVKPQVKTPVEKKGFRTDTYVDMDKIQKTVDGPLIIYEVPDVPEEYVSLQEQKQKVVVSSRFYRSLKNVQAELKNKLFGQQLQTSPIVRPPETPIVSPPEAPIVRPTESSPGVKQIQMQKNVYVNEPTDKKRHSKQKSKPDKKVKKEKTKETTPSVDDDEDDNDSQYDYPDVSLMSLNPPSDKSSSRPIGRVQPVQPNAREPTTGVSSSNRFSSMTVQEIINCLNECALPNLANLCSENSLDGQFLSDLNEHDLREKPYSLNAIEVAKFKKMKMGWRPKVN